jgi:hypothetical protein
MLTNEQKQMLLGLDIDQRPRQSGLLGDPAPRDSRGSLVGPPCHEWGFGLLGDPALLEDQRPQWIGPWYRKFGLLGKPLGRWV